MAVASTGTRPYYIRVPEARGIGRADDLYRPGPGMDVQRKFSTYVVNSIRYSAVCLVYGCPLLLLL